MYKILWKETNIGELSDISIDMWYLEGKWTSNDTTASNEFVKELSNYDSKRMLEDPSSAQQVILFSNSNGNERIYCLVMSLEDDLLTMRQVVAEAALDIFFPKRL